MSTTIVGVFGSRQQAEDALYALRNQLEAQNVAIIVRNEEVGTAQVSTGVAGRNPAAGSTMAATMSNTMGNTMVNGMATGALGAMPTNLIGELTQDAMDLGGTAGQLVGRVAALAATASFTLPVAMMGPMLQGMLGSMAMPGMVNPMMPAPLANTMQAGAPQGTDLTGRSTNSWSTQSQDWGEKVVITIQADENLPHAVDILRNHGAREVNTYTA